MPGTQTPPAPPDEQDLPDDASLPGEPSPQDSSAQAAGTAPDRELRNRTAQLGREAAEAKRLVVEQAKQIADLKDHVGRISGHLGQQAERQRQAQLAALPPERRTAAELQLLREEVAALRAQPPRQQQTGPDADTLRMARSIAQQYEDDFDLDDGAIDLTDGRLVWDTEEDFRESVRRLAKQARRERQQGDATVAKKTPAADTAATPIDKNAVKQARAEILQELGLSRPNSAQPAGGARGSAADDIATVHAGYQAKRGMKGQLEKLRDIRDAARAG